MASHTEAAQSDIDKSIHEASHNEPYSKTLFESAFSTEKPAHLKKDEFVEPKSAVAEPTMSHPTTHQPKNTANKKQPESHSLKKDESLIENSIITRKRQKRLEESQLEPKSNLKVQPLTPATPTSQDSDEEPIATLLTKSTMDTPGEIVQQFKMTTPLSSSMSSTLLNLDESNSKVMFTSLPVKPRKQKIVQITPKVSSKSSENLDETPIKALGSLKTQRSKFVFKKKPKENDPSSDPLKITPDTSFDDKLSKEECLAELFNDSTSSQPKTVPDNHKSNEELEQIQQIPTSSKAPTSNNKSKESIFPNENGPKNTPKVKSLLKRKRLPDSVTPQKTMLGSPEDKIKSTSVMIITSPLNPANPECVQNPLSISPPSQSELLTTGKRKRSDRSRLDDEPNPKTKTPRIQKLKIFKQEEEKKSKLRSKLPDESNCQTTLGKSSTKKKQNLLAPQQTQLTTPLAVPGKAGNVNCPTLYKTLVETIINPSSSKDKRSGKSPMEHKTQSSTLQNLSNTEPPKFRLVNTTHLKSRRGRKPMSSKPLNIPTTQKTITNEKHQIGANTGLPNTEKKSIETPVIDASSVLDHLIPGGKKATNENKAMAPHSTPIPRPILKPRNPATLMAQQSPTKTIVNKELGFQPLSPIESYVTPLDDPLSVDVEMPITDDPMCPNTEPIKIKTVGIDDIISKDLEIDANGPARIDYATLEELESGPIPKNVEIKALVNKISDLTQVMQRIEKNVALFSAIETNIRAVMTKTSTMTRIFTDSKINANQMQAKLIELMETVVAQNSNKSTAARTCTFPINDHDQYLDINRWLEVDFEFYEYMIEKLSLMKSTGKDAFHDALTDDIFQRMEVNDNFYNIVQKVWFDNDSHLMERTYLLFLDAASRSSKIREGYSTRQKRTF